MAVKWYEVMKEDELKLCRLNTFSFIVSPIRSVNYIHAGWSVEGNNEAHLIFTKMSWLMPLSLAPLAFLTTSLLRFC